VVINIRYIQRLMEAKVGARRGMTAAPLRFTSGGRGLSGPTPQTTAAAINFQEVRRVSYV
jgi:hypothetical protein